MDLTEEKVEKLYFKYLIAAFGSALISCIYGMVDMSVVGKYHGPDGTSALAVVAPVWNVIYSLGLLTGIGGSVIMSALHGEGKVTKKEENQYFSVAIIFSIVLAVLSWIVVIFFEKPILRFFGASTDNLLSIACEYLKPIKVVFPLFLFNQMLAAFLRNDNDPTLATIAVISGGVFNVFGDIFFTFTLDLGSFGAGLATAIGTGLTFIVLMTHFLKKANTLKTEKPQKVIKKMQEIAVNGFSSFFIDVAMGVLTVIFNRQIMKYLNTSALAVYGVIINISTFAQCCAYSVGQASQPIISTNFGAKMYDRIKEILKYAIITSIIFGIIFTVSSLCVPNVFVNIFMNPTEEVIQIAPQIIRRYAISFLILPFNIFSTYYFQATLKPKTAFIVSIARGLLISGALIMLLPLINSTLIWFAMPITELLVMIFVIFSIKRNKA